MSQTLEGGLDGQGIRIALVASRFNESVTEPLLAGAEAFLTAHDCGPDQRIVVRVPGAWELPLAVKPLAHCGRFDAVVALGALIRGETPHFDYLAQQVSRGLGQIALDSGVPVIFGVLTTDTVEQAMARVGQGRAHKGREAARAALEMATLLRRLPR